MIVAAGLSWSTGASAQTAGDAHRTPAGNVVRSDQIQVANSEWRRLSQSEVNCVDRWYRTQGSNLWSQIQRGIGPSSSSAARVRAECRGQARAPGYPVIANAGSQSLAAASDAADRAAAEKAAADKAAGDKAAADKAAADRAAANKAAAEKAAADKAIAQRAAADKAAAERAELDIAKAEAERMKVGITKAQANLERPQKSADNKTVDAMFASSATESRTSFIYGLISGPIIFSLGGVMFLLLQRRRTAP